MTTPPSNTLSSPWLRAFREWKGNGTELHSWQCFRNSLTQCNIVTKFAPLLQQMHKSKSIGIWRNERNLGNRVQTTKLKILTKTLPCQLPLPRKPNSIQRITVIPQPNGPLTKSSTKRLCSSLSIKKSIKYSSQNQKPEQPHFNELPNWNKHHQVINEQE